VCSSDLANPASFHGNIIAVHQDHTDVVSDFLPASTKSAITDHSPPCEIRKAA